MKYDELINELLNKGLKNKKHKKKKKRVNYIKKPNTPRNGPAASTSPAIASGLHSDPCIAQTPV